MLPPPPQGKALPAADKVLREAMVEWNRPQRVNFPATGARTAPGTAAGCKGPSELSLSLQAAGTAPGRAGCPGAQPG